MSRGTAGRIVVVTGSRDWECFALAVRILSDLVVRTPEGLVIHHGNARGVDLSFREAAKFVGVPQVPHPADWDRLGKRAGPLRNQEMISLGPDLCIALSRDILSSKGTFHCARLAVKAGVRTLHFFSGDCQPLVVKSITPSRIEYYTTEDDGAWSD